MGNGAIYKLCMHPTGNGQQGAVITGFKGNGPSGRQGRARELIVIAKSFFR
jgi:hypothetical protein